MMVGLLLYGYCTGVTSSRRLERATREDLATRVVSGGTHPDHSCIAEFRARHRATFKTLFVQVLQLCVKAPASSAVATARRAETGRKLSAADPLSRQAPSAFRASLEPGIDEHLDHFGRLPPLNASAREDALDAGHRGRDVQLGVPEGEP